MLSSVFLAFSVLGLSSVANGAPTSCSPEVGKAIYFLGNEPKQNTVVAISIGSDGLLSGGTVTPTGGKGSNSLNGEGQPAMPDPLVSQGSLVVVGNVSWRPVFSHALQQLPTTNN